MSYYGYPNPGAYNYQAYAAYAGATYDQYQAAAAYNAAAYRAMQQPPLPPGPPPPPGGGQQQPPALMTPVPGAGVIGQQKPAGISISQPAQRYDYSQSGGNQNKPVATPFGFNPNYNKSNDAIAAGYAQSMMNAPAPMNNMRPPQPNANFNNNNNRNWTAPNMNPNNGLMNNNNNNNAMAQKRPGIGFNQQQQPFKVRRPAPQPNIAKIQTLYCEICKISCAGTQTYKEHMEGQKHRKREQALKINEQQLQQQQQTAEPTADGQVQPTSQPNDKATKPLVTATNLATRNTNTVRCELCDVACSGRDSYLSHIRGSKHLKTLKLHKKLGKPIPADFLDEPAAQDPATQTATALPAQPQTTPLMAKPAAQIGATKPLGETPAVVSPAGAANAPTVKIEEAPVEVAAATVVVTAAPANDVKTNKLLIDEDCQNVEPVGKEYLETRVDGKIISFYCKLCDCQFNDPNAKEMHTKGRRHRLAYKKKVDPSLIVDIKGSKDNRTKQLQQQQQQQQLQLSNRRLAKPDKDMNGNGQIRPLMGPDLAAQQQQPMHNNMQNNSGAPLQQLMSQPLGAPRLSTPMSLVTLNPRIGESFDDRHIIAKHCAIYPSESEINEIHEIVANAEKALKFVSDQIAEEDYAKSLEQQTEAGKEVKTEAGSEAGELPPAPKKEDLQSFRALKGVMRVGLLSKNLLLKDETDVQLIVLCAKKPTKSLLSRVHEILIKKVEVVAPQINYSVILDKEAETIVIVKTNINALQPLITCRIMLTSPSVRTDSEQAAQSESAAAESSDNQEDLLDRRKCLDSLAALRHTKWFQAKASSVPNCVVIIRIIRDLCRRNPVWAPLNQWAMELLVERSLSSLNQPLSPGESLRRVLECIAAGVLLPNGTGLNDPCEKDPTDVLDSIPLQSRENITASAQMLLRQLAFKNIYKVLDMDCISNHYNQQQNNNNSNNNNERMNRKRQLPTSEANDSADLKKGRMNEETAETQEKVESSNMDTSETTNPAPTSDLNDFDNVNSLSDILKTEEAATAN